MNTNKCWSIQPQYSILPLYWEDNKNRLYYKSYNNTSDSCYGGSMNIQQTFMICNGKCFKNTTDHRSSYRCTKSTAFYISNNKLLRILTLLTLYIVIIN